MTSAPVFDLSECDPNPNCQHDLVIDALQLMSLHVELVDGKLTRTGNWIACDQGPEWGAILHCIKCEGTFGIGEDPFEATMLVDPNFSPWDYNLEDIDVD